MIAGWERTGFPSIPGHEWSGVVEAVGEGVDAGLVGKKCVAENVLSDGGEEGFERPGGYGQFLITEASKVQVLPADFPPAEAALIEPLAVSVRGMRRLRLEGEKAALIFGDGPIGLILVMLLRRAGVEEIDLAGGRPARLALSRDLGASNVLNYHEVRGELAGAVRGCFGHRFLIVVEASGSAKALEAALDVAELGAKILILGDYGRAKADFLWNRLLHGELVLIGSNASAEAWPEAVRLACEERLPLSRLITHRLAAERFEEAIDLARSCREAIKVVLEWTYRSRHK